MTDLDTMTLEEIGNLPIKQETCFGIIDCEAAPVARFLRDENWSNRNRYINGILVRDLGALAEITDVADSKADTVTLMEMVLVGVHSKIEALIDAWGETVPPCRDAAALFALSLSPHHRLAAREFMQTAHCMSGLFEPNSGLMVAFNMTTALRPGLSQVWRTERDEQDGCEADPSPDSQAD